MSLRIHRIALAFALAAALLPASAAGARPIGDHGGSQVHVLVGIEPGREREVRAAVAAAGGRVVDRGEKGRFLVVEPPSGGDAERLSASLKRERGVDYADENHVLRALYTPSDPSFSGQWHLSKIGAPYAWEASQGDSSVVIAVIDSGVDLDHYDLAANIDTVNDWDFVADDAIADDDEGHGTHVAGIAAAVIDNGVNGSGVAPKSTILPLKALNAIGSGYEADIASAVYRAVDRGADVINMSLGTTDTVPTLAAAVDYAIDRGVVVVAAAGNSGSNVRQYPASLPDVIGVGATTRTDTRASFSSYGTYVDLAAPGVDILSTRMGGGTTRMSGTSMAAPVVAGAAALVLAQNPTWSPTQVFNALKESSADLGAMGRDDYFGHGRVSVGDAADAVEHDSPDDELPGRLLLSSPVTGRVNAVTDPHDLYAVTLEESKTVIVRVTGDVGSDIDVRLLSSATTILADPSIVAESTGSAYPKSIDYRIEAGAQGTYYIDVTTPSGGGGYTLSWAHGYPTKATLSAPSLASWGRSATLTGAVTLTTGEPVPPAMLLLEAKPYGSSWHVVGYPITGPDGSFLAAVSPTKRTDYRVTMMAHDGLLAVTSASRTVQLRAYLTRPWAPSSVRRASTFGTAGYLKPRHVSSRRDVKISCYRSEGGAWKLKKTVYAKNSNYGSYTRYSARLSLPYHGRWKLVASVAGDSTHVATSSSARYLSVR